MNTNEALGLLLTALAPFLVIWLRSRTKKLQDELQEQTDAVTEPTRKPNKSDGSPYLTRMLEDLTRRVAGLEQQLDAAMKTIDQYSRNEEVLISRLAESSVELRITQMERDKLYEHIYSNVNIAIKTGTHAGAAVATSG